jgi:lipid-A-disaccharide synthase
MRYFLIAGEASGDLHGANLIKELKSADPSAKFCFWGGDLMKEQSNNLLKHYKDLSFMGVIEVLQNLRIIFQNFKICKQQILTFNPDVLILIDYPGFNLRMAKFAKENGIKVIYYISPKIWAWKKSRAWKIKKYVDKMFVIFPFETEFYQQFNYQVDYVGNPVIDVLYDKITMKPDIPAFISRHHLSGKPLVALLPGSRKQEISKLLPVMTEMINYFPDYEFVVAGSPSIPLEFYQPFLNEKKVTILFNETYQILKNSQAALVASGTATLETALLNTPQVVCYKIGGGILAHIVKFLFIRIQFFSLVNIIMRKEVVKEFFQMKLTGKVLKNELTRLLSDTTYRNKMLASYDQIRNLLKEPGASKRAAKIITQFLLK